MPLNQRQLRLDFHTPQCHEQAPCLTPPVYDPPPPAATCRDRHVFELDEMNAIAAAADEAALHSQP